MSNNKNNQPGDKQRAEYTPKKQDDKAQTVNKPEADDKALPVEEPKKTESRLATATPNRIQPAYNAPKSVQTQSSATPVTDKIEQIKVNLQAYLDKRAVSKTEAQKADAMNFLFNIMKDVLNTQELSDFRKYWSTVLNFFHQNKDKINTLTLFQGVTMWNQGKEAFEAFRVIGWIALKTANPATRFEESEYDMNVLTGRMAILGVKATENINGFYSL